MNTKIRKNPPILEVTTDNFFHFGWLEAVLGIKEREFNDPDLLTRDEDCDAYRDGYIMGKETPCVEQVGDITARMTKYGQLKITTHV